MINGSILYSAYFLLILNRSVFSITEASETKTHQKLDISIPDEHARQKWIKLEQDLKRVVANVLRSVRYALMKEVYKKEVSAPCLGALLSFEKALKDVKLWAYQMLDASGRLPEGFLNGALFGLGNYEECLEIKVNENKLKLQGQYCTVNLLPPLPVWKPFSSAHLIMPEVSNISAPDSVITHMMKIIHNLHISSAKVGLCTPSKCNLDDVNKLVSIIPEQIGLSWQFQVSRCEVKKSVEFTHAQLVVLYIMGVIVFLVLTGTIVDKLYSSEEMEKSTFKSTVFEIGKSFSFTTNAKKLANFTGPEPELSFVYGIIVIVFCWNVVSNTFMYVNYDIASNFMAALRFLKQPFYEIALNRIMPLQALLFLSGFVTTYRVVKSRTQLNVFTFIISKLCRYIPTYTLLLALLLLTPTWGSGPTWYSYMNPVYNRCEDNWWYNILFINNFLGSDKLCLDHTWVFAVAAQLHVIAVFILLPLTICPKIGLMVNFILAIASLTSVAVTNFYYELPPNEMAAFFHPKDRSYYAEHTYYRVYTHVNIYCAGVFVGYFLAKNRDLKISKKMSALLWLITGTGLLAALCVVHEWREGYIPSPHLSALYATFSKVSEASFLSWLTIACMTGHAGGVEDILGWRPFVFFGRLTFIAYTMHIPIMNMVMSFKKSPVFAAAFEIFHVVLAHITGTYIISYILHMFLEAPFISLTGLLSRHCKGRTQ